MAKLIILSNGVEVLPGRSIISFFKKKKNNNVAIFLYAKFMYVKFIQLTASHVKSEES